MEIQPDFVFAGKNVIQGRAKEASAASVTKSLVKSRYFAYTDARKRAS